MLLLTHCRKCVFRTAENPIEPAILCAWNLPIWRKFYDRKREAAHFKAIKKNH